MKIKLARSSGFCMGVRRAVEIALDAVNSRDGAIYSYGPLIHNPQTLDLLHNKGLTVLESGQADLDGVNGGTIIIRAHGIPPSERQRLEESGLEVIDATCPRVIRVQAIIKKHTAMGYSSIIWGNPDHPEVVGLLGYAEGQGRVISGPADVAGLPPLDRVILVAQTTQNQKVWDQVVQAVKDRWPEALIFDTICGATQRRQEEVRRLAQTVDAMVVVGGHNSGNTTRLASVARELGVKTVHVETEEELERDWLKGVRALGVTAGASTPNWMITRVVRGLEQRAHESEKSLLTVVHRALRVLVLSNLYVAFGAGALYMASSLLQGLTPRLELFGVSFFYIHAMHMLNLFLDKDAGKFNDPDRARFLERHRSALLGSGILSALCGLGLGLVAGWGVFVMLAFMTTLGLLYAVPVVPRSMGRLIRKRRLKDIPSSKTLFLSGGWALILSLVPALADGGRVGWSSVVVGFITFFLVFIRSAFSDIAEIQGDRIVGRETIPIIIGERNTLNLLNVIVAILAVILLGGWAAGLLSSLALPLLLCPAYAALYLVRFRQEQVLGGTFTEAMIDGNFILAGVLSLLWMAVQGG